jgi:protease-4
MLTGIVEEPYQQFVSVVHEGRPGLERAQVQALATGAIYTATQAQQNGLVDAIGDSDDAVAWFRSELGGDVEVIEYRRRAGLRELLFGVQAPRPLTAADAAAALLQASTGPRFLYWWPGAR